MRSKIVKIGNSQGVRIPKTLLEEASVSGEVEILAEENQLVIRSLSRPRKGWEDAFASMAEAGDDAVAEEMTSLPTQWESEEWQW